MIEKAIQFFANFWKKDKKILGRWNLDACHVKIGKKVDYSNHDHCGPCGLVPIEKPCINVSAPPKISENNIKDGNH